MVLFSRKSLQFIGWPKIGYICFLLSTILSSEEIFMPRLNHGSNIASFSMQPQHLLRTVTFFIVS